MHNDNISDPRWESVEKDSQPVAGIPFLLERGVPEIQRKQAFSFRCDLHFTDDCGSYSGAFPVFSQL